MAYSAEAAAVIRPHRESENRALAQDWQPLKEVSHAARRSGSLRLAVAFALDHSRRHHVSFLVVVALALALLVAAILTFRSVLALGAVLALAIATAVALAHALLVAGALTSCIVRALGAALVLAISAALSSRITLALGLLEDAANHDTVKDRRNARKLRAEST